NKAGSLSASRIVTALGIGAASPSTATRRRHSSRNVLRPGAGDGDGGRVHVAAPRPAAELASGGNRGASAAERIGHQLTGRGETVDAMEGRRDPLAPLVKPLVSVAVDDVGHKGPLGP